MPTTSSPPGVIARAWFRWKALRLPWRRTWLVGHDLGGNTFWEFKDALNANRLRRIMRHGGQQAHYADIKISPQWHQWLRHTRDTPPTLQEQQLDVTRQARMKQLAHEADERWKSIPSFLDPPKLQQPQPAIGLQDPGGHAQQTEPDHKEGVRSAVEGTLEQSEGGARAPAEDEPRAKHRANRERRVKGESPYQQRQPKGAPSENWQPDSWTPGVATRR